MLFKKFKDKLKESKYFFISFVFHLILLFIVSGVVIINPTVRKTIFRGVLQMGGGGKSEGPAWEMKKGLPSSSKALDLPKEAKVDIKAAIGESKVLINPKITQIGQSKGLGGYGKAAYDLLGKGGGAGGGVGAGIGKGIGAGIGIYSARMNRAEMAKKYGGTPVTEEAVDRGLEYLYKHQEKDGSWKCPVPYGRGQTKNPTVGVSSLALLAFLGAGYSADSLHKYAITIKNAAEYLVESQSEDGSMGLSNGTMYNHLIATIALSEAYAVGKCPIKKNVENALNFTLDCQNRNSAGGWRYSPRESAADVSFTGWGIMALKDGYYGGFLKDEIKDGLDKAIQFVIKTRGNYVNNEKGDGACPAISLFCLALCEKLDNRLAEGLIDVVKNENISKIPYYYTIYYINLALFQVGGSIWDNWNKQFREYIVTLQNEDGSFRKIKGSDWEEQLNFNYTTAMAVLSLEVYYRYLPIYQLVKK
ncbi:MAG: prenyltransferase/squalene oxidase repeat-containing protein [Candidatus Firestonebacteria bacterium]